MVLKAKIFLSFLASLFLLSSCTSWIEIPEEKKDFIGTWKSEHMTLEITDGGRLDYSYTKWSTSSSLTWPIQEFSASHIRAWVWKIGKTFSIDTPISLSDDWRTQVTINWEVLYKQWVTQRLMIPELEDLEELILNNIWVFVESIWQDDFDILHQSLSIPFQRDHSPESLREVFQGFIWYDGILAGFVDWDITFSKPPSLNDNNLLQLQGITYHSELEHEFHFEYVFIYEYPEWKPLSLNYRVF